MPSIQADNLIVDYTDAGTGVPIVFIPGMTEFKEAFEFQSRGLQDKYRIISYDLRRGLKKSTDYTIELLVEDLHQFLKALGLDSAVICGHSFSGLIAMQFALQYPEKAKALILVSSFPTSPTGISQERFSAWISSTRHPFHRSLGKAFKVQIARLIGRKSQALEMEDQIAAVKAVAGQAAQLPPTTISQRMQIVARSDFRAALPEIISPALIVAGSEDREIFLSNAQQLYESIPDATLEVIEGAGHFCFLTKHDEFNLAVDDFLSARLASIS